jgi:hypothetical protein
MGDYIYCSLVPLAWPLKNLKKNNGTCQLMDAVDNTIHFWATSHRDLGCPRATLPILDFRIPAPHRKGTQVFPLVLSLQFLLFYHCRRIEHVYRSTQTRVTYSAAAKQAQ